MQLGDYLRVPYLLEARFVELSPSVWVNRLSYPELPNCSAESPELETALRQLELKRVLVIIGMLDDGKAPSVPRPPLTSDDQSWICEHSDVSADIVARIRKESRTIRPA